MDLRARFENLLHLVDQVEWCGAVDPDVAEDFRRAIRALWVRVSGCSRCADLPPLLRQMNVAQGLLTAHLN